MTETASRESLILDSLPLVGRMAGAIKRRQPLHDIQDLMQAGVIGLIDAIDKYDPQKGAAFNTYAGERIRGAILDSLHLRKKHRYEPLPDKDDRVDIFGDPIFCDPVERIDFERWAAKLSAERWAAKLSAALPRLHERRREVLRLYYFEDIDMTGIAQIFKVTIGRISQIHKDAILQLREIMGAPFTTPLTASPQIGTITRNLKEIAVTRTTSA